VPTKRRRIGRAPVPEVPAWYVPRFLLYGEEPADPAAEADPFEWWLLGNLELGTARVVARQVWAASGAELLRSWVRARPGTRPWAWWALEAPRAVDTPWRCEPRRRVGGVGVAVRDRFAAYDDGGPFGLPWAWLASTLDPADPPRFESEASFLRRHRLLLPAERRRLTAADFRPVALALTPETADLQDDTEATDGQERPGPGAGVAEGAGDGEPGAREPEHGPAVAGEGPP